MWDYRIPRKFGSELEGRRVDKLGRGLICLDLNQSANRQMIVDTGVVKAGAVQSPA